MHYNEHTFFFESERRVPARGNRARPPPVADKERAQSCAAVEKRDAAALSLRAPQMGRIPS